MSDAVLLHNPEKLRAWREETGLRREQVCTHFTDDPDLPNLSFGWLAALEGGYNARQPSVQLLNALARYYGHDPGELLAEGTPA